MRILFVTSNYPEKINALCGVGTYMAHQAQGLAQKGHDVHVLLLGMKETREYQENGITFHEAEIKVPAWTLNEWIYDRLPLHELIAQWRTNRFLGKLVSRISPDLIETTHFRFPCLFFLLRRNRPKVVTRAVTTQKMATEKRLNAFSKKQQMVFGMENASLKKSDFLVTHTRAHIETVVRETGIKEDRFSVIPLGVPMPLTVPEANQSGNLNVLYVGRLDIRKGVDILVRTMVEVMSLCPDAHFTLAGDDQREAFEKMFFEQGGKAFYGRVIFEGRVSDPRLQELYRKCDIFVSPSRYESFGLTFVEAMSYGKPVVGLIAGGTTEVVSHGVSGFLTDPEKDNFTSCVMRLIEDRELRLKMGEQAREEAERKFSTEKFVENMENYYEALLKGKEFSISGNKIFEEVLK